MRQRRCRTRSTACARSRKVNDPAERAHLLSAGRELLRVSDVCGSGFGKRIAAHQAACPVKAQLAAHRTGDTDLEVLLDIGRLVADGLHRLLSCCCVTLNFFAQSRSSCPVGNDNIHSSGPQQLNWSNAARDRSTPWALCRGGGRSAIQQDFDGSCGGRDRVDLALPGTVQAP